MCVTFRTQYKGLQQPALRSAVSSRYRVIHFRLSRRHSECQEKVIPFTANTQHTSNIVMIEEIRVKVGL